MSLKIEVFNGGSFINSSNCYSIDKLKHLLSKNIIRLDKVLSHVNIVFVSLEYIRKLNNDFRSKDMPTDVLSFNIADGLGEIYICADFIKQNLHNDSRLAEEIFRMIIHGILHLVGFDHSSYFTKKESYNEPMFEIQEKILQDMCS